MARNVMNDVNERRIKILYIDQRMMLDILRGKVKLDVSVPVDAQLIGVEYSWLRQAFGMAFESMEFESTPLGAEYPMLDLRLESEAR